MWNEIDIIYSTYNINIPLIGSGITRFKGVNLTEQELLELLLISLRLSNIKFKSDISIIIHKSKIENICFVFAKQKTRLCLYRKDCVKRPQKKIVPGFPQNSRYIFVKTSFLRERNRL